MTGTVHRPMELAHLWSSGARKHRWEVLSVIFGYVEIFRDHRWRQASWPREERDRPEPARTPG